MTRGRSTRAPAVAKAERRQQILTAARDEFAKRGYHQTTIDDIVTQAGVARGTFYLYFEDKRAVFSDLIDRFAVELGMTIVRITSDDPTQSVAVQVRENIRRILGACLADRAMTKILFNDAVGVDPAFDRKLMNFYDSMVGLLTESLRDGQGLGVVSDGEPRVLAYLTLGALKELLYQAVTLGLAEESAGVVREVAALARLADGQRCLELDLPAGRADRVAGPVRDPGFHDRGAGARAREPAVMAGCHAQDHFGVARRQQVDDAVGGRIGQVDVVAAGELAMYPLLRELSVVSLACVFPVHQRAAVLPADGGPSPAWC